MTEVTIADGKLIVEMTGADVLLATRHHLEYPLTHVESAEVVTDVLAQSKVGWKMIGGYLPGHFRNGYFKEHGTRVFWNVRNIKTHTVIAVNLTDQDTMRLVLSVADPAAMVAMIREATSNA